MLCTGFGSQQCFSHSKRCQIPHLPLLWCLWGAPFSTTRCSKEEEHAVSQPAEQDGGVVQLHVLGVAFLLHFLCKLTASLLHIRGWTILEPPVCVTPPLKPYAPSETNLDSPCSVGWSKVLSASNHWVTKSLLQVCTESGFGRVQSLYPNTSSTLGPFRCCNCFPTVDPLPK